MLIFQSFKVNNISMGGEEKSQWVLCPCCCVCWCGAGGDFLGKYYPAFFYFNAAFWNLIIS